MHHSCCYEQTGAVAMSSGGLFILDEKGLLTVEQADKFGYYFHASKIYRDTLLMVDSVIKAQDYDKVRNVMKACTLYIDSIGGYQFNYDTIPDELIRRFNKSEKIDHFLYHKNYIIYTTYNGSLDYSKEASNKLYVQSKADNRTVVVNLVLHSLPTPDFLFEDVTGDGEKEIVVFGLYHLMNHDLADISVYRVNFN